MAYPGKNSSQGVVLDDFPQYRGARSLVFLIRVAHHVEHLKLIAEDEKTEDSVSPYHDLVPVALFFEAETEVVFWWRKLVKFCNGHDRADVCLNHVTVENDISISPRFHGILPSFTYGCFQ